jgi:ferredoxin
MAGKKPVRVRVERDKCVGAAMCVAVAPSIFEIDAEGKAVVRLELVDEPERAMQAAEECPALAIVLNDAETGEQLFP